MAGGEASRRVLATALCFGLACVQVTPLLAATLAQLKQTVAGSGLVGSQFEVKRTGSNLSVVSQQIYPNPDELKLALIQLASLLEASDTSLKNVKLRAYLLNNANPVEGTISPQMATRLQREGNPDMLEQVRLAAVKGAAPAKKPLLTAARPPGADEDTPPVLGEPNDLPVIGEPLFPGQKVADPALGNGAEAPSPADRGRPFRAGVSVLRAGSPIPVLFERDMVIDGNQPMPFQAVVLQDILNDEGDLVIPGGSEVRGSVEPTPSGARVALREILVNGRSYPVRAVSQVFPAQVTRTGGDAAGGAMIGGLVGGVGGSILGSSVDRRTGGLWGGLLGGLLGSFLGGSLNRPQTRTTIVIPAGTVNSQLVEDLNVNN